MAALKYFRVMPARLRGIPVEISRTGYTGDLGREIWVAAAQALPLWDALVEAGRPYDITPAGMLALDVARIEAGLILLDVDYTSARKTLIPSQRCESGARPRGERRPRRMPRPSSLRPPCASPARRVS